MIASYWPHLLAVLVGAALTVQVGMNAAMARAVGSPLWAALVSFGVGLLALLPLVLLFGQRPPAGAFAQVPAWAWFGGVLGAVYVASVTFLGLRLGGLTLVALVVAGQMVAGLLVDRFGVLGFPQVPVTPLRLLGAVLLVAGALLVLRR
jgi:transporter family-2 protein